MRQLLLICALACACSGVLSASITRSGREDVPTLEETIVPAVEAAKVAELAVPAEQPVAELKRAEIPVAVEPEPTLSQDAPVAIVEAVADKIVEPIDSQRAEGEKVEVAEPVAIVAETVAADAAVPEEKVIEIVEQVLAEQPAAQLKVAAVEAEEPVAVVVPAAEEKITPEAVVAIVEPQEVAAVESLRSIAPAAEIVEPSSVVAVVESSAPLVPEAVKTEVVEPVESLRSIAPVADVQEPAAAIVPIPAEIVAEPVAIAKEEIIVVPAVRTVPEVILEKAEEAAAPVAVVEVAAVKDVEVAPVESLKSVEPIVEVAEPVAVIVESIAPEAVEEKLTEKKDIIQAKSALPLVVEKELPAAEVSASVVEPVAVEQKEAEPVEALRSAAIVPEAVEKFDPIVEVKPLLETVETEKVVAPVESLRQIAPVVPAEEPVAAVVVAAATEEKVDPIVEKLIVPVESLRQVAPVEAVNEPSVLVTEEEEKKDELKEAAVVPAIKSVIVPEVVEIVDKQEAPVAVEELAGVVKSVPIAEGLTPVKEVEAEPHQALRGNEVRQEAGSSTTRPNLLQQIIMPVNNFIQGTPLGQVLNRPSSSAAAAAPATTSDNAADAAQDDSSAAPTTAAPPLLQAFAQGVQNFFNPNAANANAEAEATTARPNLIQQVQSAVGSVFNRPATNAEQPAPAAGNPLQNIVAGVQNFFRPSTASPASASASDNAPAEIAPADPVEEAVPA